MRLQYAGGSHRKKRDATVMKYWILRRARHDRRSANTSRSVAGIRRDLGDMSVITTSIRNKMQYVLTGFTQETGVRIFAFQYVGENRARMEFAVRIHLGLLRQYGITVQEAALQCRGILERRNELEGQRTFTHGEADMRLYADTCASRRAAANERRRPRR